MIKKRFSAMAAIAVVCAFQADAAVISYEQISQIDNRYEYSYQITNNNIVDGIENFSLNFDYNLYDNLQITTSPMDWDALVFQIDEALLADGVADWATFSDPLAFGNTLTGFNVAFDFMGDDVTQLLQSQSFEVFNSNFDIIDSGLTELSKVPEPSSFVLFSLCLAAFGRFLGVSKQSGTPVKL